MSDDIIFDNFQEQAYPAQAMGRPVLGSPEIIRQLPREAIVTYLHDHYGAARMVLSASGNLDHDRVVELADKLLSTMPAESAVLMWSGGVSGCFRCLCITALGVSPSNGGRPVTR